MTDKRKVKWAAYPATHEGGGLAPLTTDPGNKYATLVKDMWVACDGNGPGGHYDQLHIVFEDGKKAVSPLWMLEQVVFDEESNDD